MSRAISTSTLDAKPIPHRPSPRMERLLRPVITTDLNLEAAYGWTFSGPINATGLARVRAGMLVVRSPFYFTLGATAEHSQLADTSLGIQAEIAHLERGFWGQLGVFKDIASSSTGIMASAGFAIFGVETQWRSEGTFPAAPALYLKLRLPVTVLARALR